MTKLMTKKLLEILIKASQELIDIMADYAASH
jgi:hypothetical protein